MNSTPPRSCRLGLVMRADDLAALDRLAVHAEVSRANYARKIIKQHLRTIAAAQKAGAAA